MNIVYLPGLFSTTLVDTANGQIVFGGTPDQIAGEFRSKALLQANPTTNPGVGPGALQAGTEVIASALRCMGHSVQVWPYDWRLLPEEIAPRLALRSVPDPCCIVGHSYGALVAAALVQQPGEWARRKFFALGAPADPSVGNWQAVALLCGQALTPSGAINDLFWQGTADWAFAEPNVLTGIGKVLSIPWTSAAQMDDFLKLVASWDSLYYLCPRNAISKTQRPDTIPFGLYISRGDTLLDVNSYLDATRLAQLPERRDALMTASRPALEVVGNGTTTAIGARVVPATQANRPFGGDALLVNYDSTAGDGYVLVNEGWFSDRHVPQQTVRADHATLALAAAPLICAAIDKGWASDSPQSIRPSDLFRQLQDALGNVPAVLQNLLEPEGSPPQSFRPGSNDRFSVSPAPVLADP